MDTGYESDPLPYYFYRFSNINDCNNFGNNVFIKNVIVNWQTAMINSIILWRERANL